MASIGIPIKNQSSQPTMGTMKNKTGMATVEFRVIESWKVAGLPVAVLITRKPTTRLPKLRPPLKPSQMRMYKKAASAPAG